MNKLSFSARTILLATTLLLQLSALCFHARGAVTEAWVRRYSNLGDSTDQAAKVLRPAGDFLVVGATADFFAVQGLLLIKYSGANGSVLWQRRYDGPATYLISGDPAASILQETTNLTLPSSWSAVAPPAVTNRSQVSVSVPAANGNKFFRLKSL